MIKFKVDEDEADEANIEKDLRSCRRNVERQRIKTNTKTNIKTQGKIQIQRQNTNTKTNREQDLRSCQRSWVVHQRSLHRCRSLTCSWDNSPHHHHHNHPHHHHHHHNYKHKFCSFKTNSAGTQIFVTMIISSSLTIISHSCKSTLHHCQPSASSPLLLSSFSSVKSIPAIRIDGIIISITVIGDQLIIIIFVSKPSITAVPSSSPVVIPPITTHSRQCPVNSVNCPSRWSLYLSLALCVDHLSIISTERWVQQFTMYIQPLPW